MKKVVRKKTKFIQGKFISIFLYIILLFLIIALLVSAGIIKNPLNILNKKTQEREVIDICSIIGGKLIHTIEEEGDCQNICLVECDSLGKKSKKYEFQYRENNCNKCFCYCN